MEKAIEYHLNELAIAADPQDHRRCMPEIHPDEKVVLDIGCGIGQMFLANKLDEEVIRVGLDVDLCALRYGTPKDKGIYFINGGAERLPCRDGIFDLVISRVSLPYTNIPVAIREIGRVLKEGGRVWISLHSFSMAIRHLGNSIRHCDAKDTVFRSYVILNGLLLHGLGKVMRFPRTGGYESFQTGAAVTRLLEANSFSGSRCGRRGFS
jgi:SAM-dependent methyltransferase